MNQRVPIVEQFRQWVAREPDADAVVHGDTVTSYAILAQLAETVAGRLLDAGVRRGDAVLALPGPGVDRLSSMLGIHLAGALFVPLSPDDSAGRWREIATDVSARVVLAGVGRDDAAGSIGLQVVTDDATGGAPPAGSPLQLEPAGPDDLGLVAYTTGSTGRPKGIDLLHRSMIDYIAWTSERFGLRADDRVVHLAPFNYDVGVWELLWPLTAGAAVVLVDDDARLDSGQLVRSLAQQRVTHLHVTPPMLRRVVRERSLRYCRALRVVLTSSDVLPVSLMNEALGALGPDRELFHLYGVTEVSVESSAWKCSELPADDRPRIGEPVTGTTLYLLNNDLEEVEVGGEGTLYISSPSLALGYRGQPAATAAALVPDPFGEPGSRLYATGDRARLLADGIVLLGREDRQVKVHGHRVDLAGVEAVLELLGGVDLAAVRVDETGHLVTHLLLSDQNLTHERVRGWAVERLPGPAVPTQYHVLERVPETFNGKIDRAMLAGASTRQLLPARVTTDSGPRSAVEAELMEVLGTLLRLDLQPDDDFFAIGGSSLLAMAAADELVGRGWHLAVAELFRHRTVRALVAAGGLTRVEADWRAPIEEGSPVPLTRQQLGLWLAQEENPTGVGYHIPLVVEFPPSVSADRVEQAVRTLVARHGMLRARFERTPDGPVQRVLPPETADALLDVCRTAVPSDDAFEAWIALDLHRPFDLGAELPARARILRGPKTLHLAMVLHHVAVDGGSLQTLLDDLGGALDAGPTEPALGFVEVAQRHGYLEAPSPDELAWWREHLRGAEPVVLPFPRTGRTGRGGAATVHDGIVEEATSGRVRDLARARHTTEYAVLRAAVVAFLSRVGGSTDVVTAVPLSVRPPGAGGVVGNFTATTMMRTEVVLGSSLDDLIDATAVELVEVMSRAGAGTSGLAADSERSGTPVGELLRVMIGLDEELRCPTVDGVALRVVEVEHHGVDHDVEFQFVDWARSFVLTASYDDSRVDASWAGRLTEAFLSFLSEATRRPDAPLHQLPLGGLDVAPVSGEADQAGTVRCCTPCAVLNVSSESPELVALVDHEGPMTYGELGRAVRGVRAELERQGVQAGDVVTVLAERSRHTIVTMLAAMQLSAVYHPVKSGDPVERLRAIRAVAKPVAIARGGARASEDVSAWAEGVPVLDVADATPEDGATAGARTRGGDHGSLPAYLLFTSGTTGEPKGVLVPHGALINRLAWSLAGFDLSPDDRHVQKTPLDFDVAMAEILQPLVSGGSLSMPADGVERDQDALAAALDRFRPTIVHFVPSALRAFLDSGHRLPASVRLVLSSGEGLPRALVRQLLDLHPTLVHQCGYGPTETTIEVSFSPAEVDGGPELVPLGRELPGIRMELLDDLLQPVVPFRHAQVYIGGRALATGYLHDARRTAASFVPDVRGEGGRLYATGDIAYRDLEGRLHFVGRNDRQLKVRGVRVEAGAVEAVLARHPDVVAAVVEVERRDGLGESLVAYVHTRRDIAHTELRAHVGRVLARHHVPDRFIEVEDLGLTASGKLDRRALRPLRDSSPDGTSAGQPGTGGQGDDLVERVRVLLAGVLEMPDLGPDDGFFDVGGHSLLAARAAASIGVDLGAPVPMTALFEAPTARRLSDWLADRRGAAMPAPAPSPSSKTLGTDAEGLLFLPPQQRQLWVAAQLAEGDHDYDVVVGWVFTDIADPARLLDAVDTVVAHHSVLRTSYVQTSDGPRGRVHVGWRPDRVRRDASTASAEELGAALTRLLRERSFDLEQPPTKMAVGQSEEGSVLVLSIHHIAVDAWALDLLLGDIVRVLRDEKPPPAPQYHAVTAGEGGDAADRASLDHWLSVLAGAEPLALPGAPDPDGRTDAQRRELFLESGHWAAVVDRCRILDVTPFALLLAAMVTSLFATTHQSDLVVATDTANRTTAEQQATVGLFVNPVALRLSVDDRMRVSQLVRSAAAVAVDGLRHQTVPFADVFAQLRSSGAIPADRPLVRAKLVLQEGGRPSVAGPAARELRGIDPFPTSDNDLLLAWEPMSDGLEGLVQWRRSALGDADAIRFAATYRSCLLLLTQRDEVDAYADPEVAEVVAALGVTSRHGGKAPRQLRRGHPPTRVPNNDHDPGPTR